MSVRGEKSALLGSLGSSTALTTAVPTSLDQKEPKLTNFN